MLSNRSERACERVYGGRSSEYTAAHRLLLAAILFVALPPLLSHASAVLRVLFPIISMLCPYFETNRNYDDYLYFYCL
jgi:hypothetical protein